MTQGGLRQVELLGSGMVNRRVIANCGLDPDVWQGFERDSLRAWYKAAGLVNRIVQAPGYVTPWAAPGMPRKVIGQLLGRHAPVRAGLGGVLWGLVQQGVTPQIGAQVNLLLFIVIIIGGLGSTVGCLVGALLVGLVANYVGFLAPKAALFSNIGLMVAVLLWRPQGLYPVGAK